MRVCKGDSGNKGFTLVELIVVLVILAILAALLVPALLGYIDKAKESKYLIEAGNIYRALQAANSELYAQNKEHVSKPTFQEESFKKKINPLISPTEMLSVEGIGYKKGGELKEQQTEEQLRGYYTIIRLYKLKFKSQDGNTVVMTFEDGAWKMDEEEE